MSGDSDDSGLGDALADALAGSDDEFDGDGATGEAGGHKGPDVGADVDDDDDDAGLDAALAAALAEEATQGFGTAHTDVESVGDGRDARAGDGGEDEDSVDSDVDAAGFNVFRDSVQVARREAYGDVSAAPMDARTGGASSDNPFDFDADEALASATAEVRGASARMGCLHVGLSAARCLVLLFWFCVFLVALNKRKPLVSFASATFSLERHFSVCCACVPCLCPAGLPAQCPPA